LVKESLRRRPSEKIKKGLKKKKEHAKEKGNFKEGGGDICIQEVRSRGEMKVPAQENFRKKM